jgi:TonB-linked SusC/RagA family outer membrane protein
MKFKKRLYYSIVNITWQVFMLMVLSTELLFAQQVKPFQLTEILNKKVTINVKNETLEHIAAIIKKQTGANLSFSAGAIKANGKLTLAVNDKKLIDLLHVDFAAYDIDFDVVDNQIVLFQKGSSPAKHLDESPIADKLTAAMNIQVSGLVTDENNQPLAGVTISEKNTGKTISTDENGIFSITVENENAVLVVTYVGRYSKEIMVGNQKQINISLLALNNSIDDVVVVGYGTQKKVTNTGAQSSMAGKLLVQSPAANISNSLVGRLPGLFASQASGEPGNDQSTLRIRGVGTFNGSQEPLVLVDGIQVDNYNNIDPNEIENITILKDASSTAVYGIRGANGVLIITTKRGVVGPAKVSYTFNEAINSFTAVRSQMNSADYAVSFNKALEGDSYISGSIYTPRYSESDIAKYKSGEDPIFYSNTDWFKLILKKASTQQQHNLNISGGTNKVRYAISLGTFSQAGLFNNTNLSPDYDAQIKFRRYNFRSNLNFTITKRFRAAIDISSQTESRTGNALDSRTVIDFINSGNPTLGPGILNNKLVVLKSGEGTPAQLLYQAGYKRDYRNFLNGSIRLDHDLDFITKGLTTHAIISYQNFNNQIFTNSKPFANNVPGNAITYLLLKLQSGETVYLPQTTDAQYDFSEGINKNRRTTAEFAVDYKRKFGDHNVSALLLYNQQKTINPGFAFLVPSGYQSVVGRATYDYKNRYLAEVNMAYNGTENFAPGNRFGLFPAYSLGWIASEESFFPTNNVLTFLKFRGSYGEVGNDQIGSDFLTSSNRFLYRPTAWLFSGGSRFGEVGSTYNQLGGVVEGRSSNPNLTWERAVKTNVGAEMSFWNKKIMLSVDLFKEKRDNILANKQTVPGIVGVNIPPENLGKMQNKGFEFDLGLNNNIGLFNYQVKANYSFARNKILFQDEIPPTYAYQSRTGTRYGQYFGLVDEGLFNTWNEVNDTKRPVYEWNTNRIQPGDIRFKDVNGDGKINDFDQVAIGYSNIPEITYGFSLYGEYKGLSLSVLFQGVGNVSLNYTRRFNQAFFDQSPAGAVDYLIESWTPERYAAGLPIKFPRFSVGNGTGTQNNYRQSTFFLADASYLRLKNIEFGYNITGKIFKKAGLNSARIFANANNLFTWSKTYKGADPESPPTTVNAEQYPLVKTVNMGVNINF